MLVSGLPDRTEHHAKHAADVAMEMVQAIQKVKINFLKEPLTVKLGMHSGPVVAGLKCHFLDLITRFELIELPLEPNISYSIQLKDADQLKRNYVNGYM